MKIGFAIKIARYSKTGAATKLTKAFEAGLAEQRAARDKEIPKRATETVKQAIRDAADQVLLERLQSNYQKIVNAITTDLNRYGGVVARYFTRLKSPSDLPENEAYRRGHLARKNSVFSKGRLVGKNPSVQPNSQSSIDINLGVMGDRAVNDSRTVPVTGARRVNSIRWRALSRRTIKRKKRSGNATTFFLHTGELRTALVEGLGPAYAKIVNPQITFEEAKDGSRVMKVKALLNPRFRSSLFADLGASTQNPEKAESLVLSHMKAVSLNRGLQKLANLGSGQENQGGPYRPFVQPALAFWVVNRLPSLFTAAVQKAVKPAVKKKSRARDYTPNAGR